MHILDAARCDLVPASVLLPLLLSAAISLEPNIGTTSGGDLVKINGTLMRSCTVPLCPPAEILLDGLPLRFVGGADNVFVTPPHAPGKATLTTRGIAGNPVVPDAFTYVDPFESPADRYERILFPIALGNRAVGGAFGNQWITALFARNDQFFNAELQIDGRVDLLKARTSMRLDDIDAPDGFLGRLQKSIADTVAFSLRLNDTEIPVVREREWSTGNITLLNIPLENSSRVSLRVYAIDDQGKPIRLRVLGMADNYEIVARDIILQGDELKRFSIADLRSELPSWTHGLRVAIDVRKLFKDEAQIWAFAAITDNATGRVTLVTPQR